MTQTNQVIDVYRGDSKLVLVDLTNADDGTPFDPTAPGINIQWRMACTMFGLDQPSALDPGPVLAKSLGQGITALPGQVQITLTPTDTNLEVRKYRHALRIYDGADVATTMTGWVVIHPVTQMGTLIGGAAGGAAAAQIRLSATVPTRVKTGP